MSEVKEHKMCNLSPKYANAEAVQFGCKCGRSVLYNNTDILALTPYKLNEVRYYLFHKDWEWNGPCGGCAIGECEYLK